MRRRAALALLAALAAATIADAAPRRPALLLLGTYHLANNHRDVTNVTVEDVLTPTRQREIGDLVAAIARWRPTRVAVEWQRTDQATLDRRYADYRAGRVAATANEREQIAFRLAARLGLAGIDAIDWNAAPPGPSSAYDPAAWAAAHGQAERFTAFVADGQRVADDQARAMRCSTVADWYRTLNTPAQRVAMNRPYFAMASLGDDQDNPGAAWVGTWYARNLRIFDHLRQLSAPGDRVFVLYGAGHAYLLDRFARDSGAYDVVDPLAFLPKAGARRPCG